MRLPEEHRFGETRTGRARAGSLLLLGAILGLLVGIDSPALADNSQAPALSPEVAAFAEAFERIKSRYVEGVDDKKLVSDAIIKGWEDDLVIAEAAHKHAIKVFAHVYADGVCSPWKVIPSALVRPEET